MCASVSNDRLRPLIARLCVGADYLEGSLELEVATEYAIVEVQDFFVEHACLYEPEICRVHVRWFDSVRWWMAGPTAGLAGKRWVYIILGIGTP
jgi:hypothetical protein